MEVSGIIGGADRGVIAKILRDKWWLLHIASLAIFISSFIKSFTFIGSVLSLSLNLILLTYTLQLTRP
jgi:hypothetical protein